jgi:hypothetical protein
MKNKLYVVNLLSNIPIRTVGTKGILKGWKSGLFINFCIHIPNDFSDFLGAFMKKFLGCGFYCQPCLNLELKKDSYM